MNFKRNYVIMIIQNIIFWMISFGITLRLFQQTGEIRAIDLIYTVLFHIPFFVIVNINVFHLVPNILKKINIWLYLAMSLIAGFGVTQGLYQLSYGPIASFLFPDYYMVAVYNPLEILGIMIIYLSASTLIELSKSWFNRKETELKVSQLEEERIKNELRALRAQINPHFLFNSLNTIYGEAIKKSDKTPGMILELSSILRYVVDNMDEEKVSLEGEIEYLKKFIQLQKSRLSNPDRVLFSVSGDFSGIMISPLLLINFVENCFKHGSVNEIKDRIFIDLSLSDNSLVLETRNPISNSEIIKSDSTGTGLENAKNRMKLLYPDAHSLKIEETSDEYHLKLTLEV